MSSNRALYGVWIENALQKNDAQQLREIVEEVRETFYPPRIQPLYGVFINNAIQRGASDEELQQLLDTAEQTLSTLPAAVEQLRSKVGRGAKSS